MITLLAVLQITPTWKSPSWVAVIGILLTWISGVIAIMRYRSDRAKAAKEAEALALKTKREMEEKTEQDTIKLIRVQLDEELDRRLSAVVMRDRLEDKLDVVRARIGTLEMSMSQIAAFLSSQATLNK